MAAQTVLVTKLTGQAWMRGPDGNLTELREGMRIPADAEIVTASGSTVQLQADGQPPLMVGENQDVHLTADLIQPPTVEEAAVASPANAQIDQIIAAINAGQDPFDELDPTAATLSGGSEGGSTFVRLSSIIEAVSPLALEYGRAVPATTVLPLFSGVSALADSTDPGNPNPGADVPTLDVSNPGNVNEGSDAKFDITLGKAVDAETTITFKLGGDIESDDIGTPVVTIGGTTVTLVNNGNGTYSFQVPAGTTGGIVVTVPTHDDAVFEGSEKLTLEATLSGKTASGVDLPAGITDTGNAAIVDTQGPGADVPTLDVSNPGNVNEGSDAKFDITLGKAVDAETTITFKLGGDIESDDIGTPVVTIGGTTVTLVNNGNGTYSFQVPAGTTGGIVVTVPTHDDAVFEGSEKLTLEATLSGKTASGVDLPAGITDTGNAAIIDTESTDPGNPNPGADVPTLDVSNPGNVNEGSDAKFDITLGKAVDAETTITFKLGGDIESDDIGTPVVTIGGTTVTLVNNGNGTYSFQVPAGTTGGIVVTVPTHDDAVFEGSEKLTLEATLSGKTASGVDLPAGITDTGNAAIVDTESTDPGNPNPGADVPTLDVSNPGNVNEGS
ncbi:retention module-containing protein, partial [Comamonas sp. AG1104]|uniref:retention module-containing protein n=1 Tax=Comamonas sp. AG1104 TaxID=2183900 RepID=UPI000E2CCC31